MPMEKGAKKPPQVDKADMRMLSSRQVAPVVSFDGPAPAVATVLKAAPPTEPESELTPPPSMINSGLRRKRKTKSNARVAPNADAA